MPTKFVHARIENLAEINKRLETDEVLGRAFGDAMRASIASMYGSLMRWVPRGKGALAASIEHEVQQAPVPRWGRVFIRTMPTRRGFRYGGALEGSKKIRFRYSSGPQRGKLTRGWFSRTRSRTAAAIRKLFANVERQMESRFNRS